MKLIIVLCFIILYSTSCNKEAACLRYASVIARIEFKTLNDTLRVEDTILPEPIIVFDSFYVKTTLSKGINFLMKSTADSVQFLIAADSSNAIFDTINLFYNRQLNFVSKECGYNYYYKLLNIKHTKQVVKNIEIKTADIDENTLSKHITIYY